MSPRESANKIEETKVRMKRLMELFSVSSQFGEWWIDESEFTEEEQSIILRAEETANKRGIDDHLAMMPKAVFVRLSDEEQSLILLALEIFVHHMKYSYHGGMKAKEKEE